MQGDSLERLFLACLRRGEGVDAWDPGTMTMTMTMSHGGLEFHQVQDVCR